MQKQETYSNCSDNWDLATISVGAEEVNPLYSKETNDAILIQGSKL